MRRLLLALLLPASLLACSAADDSATGEQDQNALRRTCEPVVACPAPPMPKVATRSWRHGFKSPLVTALGAAQHRGRDNFINVGEPQTVIGKIAYSVADKDLFDEEVDVF